jgi:electron transfer flavoprotein alpha subunit
MTDVLVVAELIDGGLRKTTLNAISAAKTIAEGTGGAFDILAIGAGAKKAAGEVATFGARKVLATEVAGGYLAEGYAATVAAAAKAYGVVVVTATTYGKDLLPRVAGKLNSGIASDISKVEIVGGKVQYKRPVYAGNVYATVEVTTPIQLVSVRQSEFEQAAPSGGASPVEELAAVADPALSKVEFVSLEQVKSSRPELAEAKTVVSGGRALKSSENFKTVLEPLVDAFGAAMGASRAACDAGYVPNDLQVGQTGKVVAPRLYVAVGISGAIQHLAGMKGSKYIVAVNKDKEAPIAQVADYFLVADLFKAVPELTAAVKKAKA